MSEDLREGRTDRESDALRWGRRVFYFFTAAAILAAVFMMRKPGNIDVAVEEVRPAVSEEPTRDEAPKVVLVLDDFGYSGRNLNAVKNIGAPVTLAVLPNTPYAGKACDLAERNGLEVILHLPMEPKVGTAWLEKDTVMTGMDNARVKEIMENAFRSVYAAKGVSNHMGSKATGDRGIMSAVLSGIGKKGMFFLDSVTTDASVCDTIAESNGVPFFSRDIFIDNEPDAGKIKGQLEKLEQVARSKGFAIGIGHDRALTIAVLTEEIPGMKERGIDFTRLSDLLDGDVSLSAKSLQDK